MEFEEDLSRSDVEWLTYSALRDGIALSLGGSSSVLHRDTMRLAQLISPILFASNESMFARQYESREENEVRDIAAATDVSFEIALEEEIQRITALVEGKKLSHNSLHRKLTKLKNLKSETTHRSYYEGKLIERDAKHFNSRIPIDNNIDGHHDFVLRDGRLIRIRVTHETKIEAINGSDLIYEYHLLDQQRVKIAAVQYKILTDEKYVSKSKKLKSQLTRLKQCFCDGLPCHSKIEKQDFIKSEEVGHFFRFPACTAFLRATNRLQSPQSSLISRGFYLPVCLVNEIWENRRTTISEESFDNQVIRYGMFESLFDCGLLGSRWLSIEELDKLYKSQKILEPLETSGVHIKVYDDRRN